MIIDNVIVIIVAIIIITYLAINYVKKYAPINLFLIALCTFSLGIYLPVVYYHIPLEIAYQIPLGLGIFVIPCIFAILQCNNINLGKNLLYQTAQNAYNSQKYTKCITTLQKLMNIEGRKGDFLFLTAQCYYALKEYTNAKEFIYETVEKEPSNCQAYFILGNILEQEDDIDSAIDMYQKCLEIDPTFYDAYEALGILLAGKGEYDRAEKVYKEAVGYHSGAYELIYNLAMIQLEEGKTDEAEKNLELALDINPEIDEAIYSLGNIKLLKGEYNNALNLYSEITKSETYGLKAYYKIAIIYVTKNEFDKAMGVVEYLVNEDPNYVDIIENEFVFNAMRTRIDTFFRGRQARQALILKEEKDEIDHIKKERRNWFGRKSDDFSEEDNPNSILYDDIDITRTGFRKEQKNNNQ